MICPNYLTNKIHDNYVVDTEHIDERVPVAPTDLNGVRKQHLTHNYFVDTSYTHEKAVCVQGSGRHAARMQA